MKETFCPKCGHACEPTTDELLDELERVATQPGWQPVLDDQARARLRRVDAALSDLARGLQGAPAQSTANFSRAIGRFGTSTDLALRKFAPMAEGIPETERDWDAWEARLAGAQHKYTPTLQGAMNAATAVTLPSLLLTVWTWPHSPYAAAVTCAGWALLVVLAVTRTARDVFWGHNL